MVSSLHSGLSGPGLGPGRGRCVVYVLVQDILLTLTAPLWGVSCAGLASLPGGVVILLVCFILQKPELRAGTDELLGSSNPLDWNRL